MTPFGVGTSPDGKQRVRRGSRPFTNQPGTEYADSFNNYVPLNGTQPKPLTVAGIHPASTTATRPLSSHPFPEFP